MARPLYRLNDPALLGRTSAMSDILATRYAEFRVTQQQSADLAALVTTFGSDLAAWTSQETRTPVASGRKQASRAALIEGAMFIVNTVNSNPATSDEQRDALGITARKRPTPTPAPSSAPIVEVDSTSGRTVTFRLHGTAARRGRPVGVKGASVFTFVGPTAPADPADFRFEGLVTRPMFTINFDDRTEADTVWVSAFWYNEKGQSGLASLPVSVNLPAAAVVPVGGAAAKLKIAA